MVMESDRRDLAVRTRRAGQPRGAWADAVSPSQSSIPLPEGRTLDLRRDRWQGVLSGDELEACRTHGVPVGYDCAQCGWVPLCVANDEGAGMVFDPGDAVATVEERIAPAVQGWWTSFEDEVESTLREFRRGAFGVAVAREKVNRLVHTAVTDIHAERGLAEAEGAHWSLRVLADNRCPALRSPAVRTVPDPELAFRPWTEGDLHVFHSLLGNPRVWEFLPEPYPEPFDEEVARTLIELGSLEFHHRALAAEWRGVPVGQCLLRFDRAEGSRTAEVAYWLGEDYWGQRLMSRILPAFTRKSFLEHDLDVIYAWIREDHGASERVARRAGYERDFFPFEAELAETMGRPGFVRYAVFRQPFLGRETPSGD